MQKLNLEFRGQATEYMQCKTAVLVHGGTGDWNSWLDMSLKLPAPYHRQITNITHIEVRDEAKTYNYNVDEGEEENMKDFVRDFGHLFNEAEHDDLTICNAIQLELGEFHDETDGDPWFVQVELEFPFDDAPSTFMSIFFLPPHYWHGTRDAESLYAQIRRLRAEMEECKARMRMALAQQPPPEGLQELRTLMDTHIKQARKELHQRLEERKARYLAIAQAMHPRLGAESRGFRTLDADIARKIARMSIHT